MDADSSLDHVFFPDSGVVSVVAVYSDGSVIEMATIGREGFTGVKAVFGAKRSSARLLVQIPGSAAKMSRAAFTRAMGSIPSFRNLVYNYVHRRQRPRGRSRRADSGLGGRLVEGFAQQLGGQLKRESGDKATIVCLTLPSREASCDLRA